MSRNTWTISSIRSSTPRKGRGDPRGGKGRDRTQRVARRRSGVLAFDPDTAEAWAKREKKQVIMVRPETKPDDVHGMLAAQGIVTSHGGRTSHAALVARQFGKPAVVVVAAMEVDRYHRQLTASGKVLKRGIGSDRRDHGEVFAGKLETGIPDVNDPMCSGSSRGRTIFAA